MFARVLAAALLWWGAALAAAPSTDSNSVSATTGSGVSSLSRSITTTHTNVNLIFWAGTQNAGSNVTVLSVSGAGLTWTKRTSVTRNVTCVAGSVSPCNINLEVWWAFSSGTISSQTITVTFSAAATQAGMGYVALYGVYNGAAPFDTHASLPYIASGSASIIPLTAVSTAATDEYLLSLVLVGRNDTGYVPCQTGHLPAFGLWNPNLGAPALSNSFGATGASSTSTTQLVSESANLASIVSACPTGSSVNSGDNWVYIFDAVSGSAPLGGGGGGGAGRLIVGWP